MQWPEISIERVDETFRRFSDPSSAPRRWRTCPRNRAAPGANWHCPRLPLSSWFSSRAVKPVSTIMAEEAGEEGGQQAAGRDPPAQNVCSPSARTCRSRSTDKMEAVGGVGRCPAPPFSSRGSFLNNAAAAGNVAGWHPLSRSSLDRPWRWAAECAPSSSLRARPGLRDKSCRKLSALARSRWRAGSGLCHQVRSTAAWSRLGGSAGLAGQSALSRLRSYVPRLAPARSFWLTFAGVSQRNIRRADRLRASCAYATLLWNCAARTARNFLCQISLRMRARMASTASLATGHANHPA